MRKRLSPQESRAVALAAARDLLREEGVAAITLKAVAARIGRTHANLLHHFGSVAGLHRALAEEIARGVAASITGSIGRMRRGEGRLRDVIEGMFDAFDRTEGRRTDGLGRPDPPARGARAGRRRDRRRSLRDITEPGDDRPLDQATLGLVLLAIGDSLAGGGSRPRLRPAPLRRARHRGETGARGACPKDRRAR